MKRKKLTNFFAVLTIAVLAIGEGAGCIAFPVGREECVKTFEYRQKSEMTGETRREALSVTAVARNEAPKGAGDAGRVAIGMEGRVRRMDRWLDQYGTIDLFCQKHLNFGFLPGVDQDIMGIQQFEIAWVQSFSGSLRYGDRESCLYDQKCFLGGLIGCYLFIPYNLIVEPFAGSWDCPGHAWCPKNWPNGKTKNPIQASDWVRTDLYAQFAEYMEERLGKATLFSACRHGAFVGFKRFSTYRWGEPTESRTEERETTMEEKAFGRGPFEVELEVPKIGWRGRASVPPGGKEASFSLPFANKDGLAEGLVRFSGTGVQELADDASRALLEGARGQEYTVQVRLRQAPVGAVSAGRAGRENESVAVVTQVVARASGVAPYRLEKDDTTEDGSCTWRVTLLDGTKTGLEIAAEVRPKIVAELREVYLARHPGSAVESVHAAVDYVTAEGGNVLVFTGAAFELRPVVDGWSYDAATRRGCVQLHAPSDVPPDTLRQWARKHVEEIVADKNVARAVGTEPPPGARFRLLDESLENGVLTVEFEAVE